MNSLFGLALTAFLGVSAAMVVFTPAARYNNLPLDFQHPLKERADAIRFYDDLVFNYTKTKIVTYQQYMLGNKDQKQAAGSKLSIGEREFLRNNLTAWNEKFGIDSIEMKQQFRFMILTTRYIHIKMANLTDQEQTTHFLTLMHGFEAVQFMRLHDLSQWALNYQYYGYPYVSYMDETLNRYEMNNVTSTLVGQYLTSHIGLIINRIPVRNLIAMEMYLRRECKNHDQTLHLAYFKQYSLKRFHNRFTVYERSMIRQDWEQENRGQAFNTSVWPHFEYHSKERLGVPPCCHYNSSSHVVCL